MSKSAKKKKRQAQAKQLQVAQSRKVTVTPVQTRRFDGGMVDRLTSTWTSATNSINSEVYHNLRTLRARSRDLQQNNEYGRHFFNMLVNNVIGPHGIGFQSHAMRNDGTLDEIDNATIEMQFNMWSRTGQCDSTRRLSRAMLERMFVEALARDGEAIVRKHIGYNNAQRFALELIDPDLLDVDYNEQLPDDRRIIMGVEVDRFFAPVAYHFLTAHPSPFLQPLRNPERIRVSADEIIHAFVPLRPNQVRGVPWVHAGMRALRDLGGYREAAIVASRVGAAKMGFWVSPDGQSAPVDGVDSTGDAMMTAEAGEFRQLADDVRLETWDPTYPHDQFGEFNKAMLRGLAGALGVSYFSLNNDLESVNLSSARIGQQNERDLYRFVQNFVVETLNHNYFPEWLTTQIPAMGLPMSRFDKFNSPSWSPRTWPSPDPLKDAQTASLNLGLNLTSPQRVIMANGMDPEEVLTEIAQWNDRLEALGIPAATTSNIKHTEESTDEPIGETAIQNGEA